MTLIRSGNIGFINCKSNKPKNYTQYLPRNNSARIGFFRTFKTSQATAVNIQKNLLLLAEKFNATKQAKPLEGVLLTGVQHILETTIDMFSVLKKQGLRDAIVTGKSYSTHLESAQRFQKMGFEFIPEAEQLVYGRFNDSMRDATYRVWDRALQKIKKKKYGLLIALDDGADLLLTTHPKLFNGIANKPDVVIGIEQTRGGSNRSSFPGLPFPIINVAGSCIKNVIEYPKVAKAVSEKVSMLIKNEIEPQLSRNPVIGIIGNGSMGKAVTEKLVENGYTVFVYDKSHQRQLSHSKALHYPEAGLLIMSADIIIGCTGEDITALQNTRDAFLYSTQKKWLISTGSKDTEFNTLLEVIQNETKQPGQTPNPLKDIKYKNRTGFELTIIRGGFPVNFDNNAHSVPPEGIWPTRAALLLACSMSANLYQSGNPVLRTARILKLDPLGQLAILKEYQRQHHDDKCLEPFKGLNDEETLAYIKTHSEGEEVMIDMTNTVNLKR